MGSIVFYPHSGLRLPSLAFSKPKLGRSIFSFKEITDGCSTLASKRGLVRLTVSSTVDENRGGRPPRKTGASGRIAKGNETKVPQSTDGKSSNPEEIIALFRRIQSSISKGEPVNTKKRSSKSSEDKSSAESVLDVLQQSSKQVKDKASSKEGHKVLTRRGGVPKKGQRREDNPSALDLKSTRPPSKFVKRSPIPHQTTPRGKVLDTDTYIEASSSTAGDKELVRVEELKLTELKELAKSRGIKGYSKLKKSELVELLSS